MGNANLISALTAHPKMVGLKEPIWEEVVCSDGRVFRLVRKIGPGGQHVSELQVDATNRSPTVHKVEGDTLPDAILAGRPLIPKILAALGESRDSLLAARGKFEEHDYLESFALENATFKIVHRLGVHDADIACELEIKVANMGRPFRRPLTSRAVADALVSANTVAEAALDAHPDAVALLIEVMPSMLHPHQADVTASASDREDLPSKKKPPL